MISAILAERSARGMFSSLKDFLDRISCVEINKRAVENFIKAGAMDGLKGTRKQKMFSFGPMMDSISQNKKNSMTGQMSLFDLISKEERKEYEDVMPDVGEYEKEVLLGFEKEVLGVYISGHPLEEYEGRWKKNITATTADFLLDEETGSAKVKDGAKVMIGGMITDKTIKYTKNNQTMAFLTIEDLLGTVEVVVFPRDYEKNQTLMQKEAKVFIRGRANVEEEKNGKIICEKVYSFDEARRELWIQFADRDEFLTKQDALFALLADSDGTDEVVVYLSKEKAMKRLPKSRSIWIASDLLKRLSEQFGDKNIKVVEKAIEKTG